MLATILLPLALLTAQPQEVTVTNNSNVVSIDGRDITFGVKETVEELALEAGINYETQYVEVSIEEVESPQQMLNVVGLQWLRKDYVVKVKIKVDGQEYFGYGKRKTLLFAALLDVEGGEVPLNRKAFSKALQSALKDAFKSI